MSAEVPFSNVASTFWEAYLKGRPRVPQSLFARLFEYHASHGGQFTLANDVGAGVGNFSPELATRFKRVIVTEPAEGNLEIAKATLAGAAEASKYEFESAKVEDETRESGSVDMVFAANVMHFVKLEQGMGVIAKQLKPGGTFFAGLWGMSILRDERADEIWRRIFDAILGEAQDVMTEQRRRETLEIQDSGYDAIAFEDGVWMDVQRVKFNGADEDAFRLMRNAKGKYPLVSRVGEGERVSKEEDPEWFFETGLEGLKEMASTFPFTPDKDVIEPLWEDMEAALGGGKCKGYFPASIIMATKR
jgi:SAM-dependent methyltransferase